MGAPPAHRPSEAGGCRVPQAGGRPRGGCGLQRPRSLASGTWASGLGPCPLLTGKALSRAERPGVRGVIRQSPAKCSAAGDTPASPFPQAFVGVKSPPHLYPAPGTRLSHDRSLLRTQRPQTSAHPHELSVRNKAARTAPHPRPAGPHTGDQTPSLHCPDPGVLPPD